MAQYAYATRLSEHIAETPEGYLLCTSCVLCRSGTQQYRKNELDPQSGDDTLVDVFRPPAEVTAPKFLGSIAAKAVTLDHPGSGFLTALTHAWSAKGTILNARIGPEDEDGNVTVVGDIIITDPTAIQKVKDGLRQLSLGYMYELAEGEGRLEMRNLICNHAAIVESGRAGNAQIVDAVPAAPVESYEQMMRRYHRVNPQEAAPRARTAQDNSSPDWTEQMRSAEASPSEIANDDEDTMKTKDENADRNGKLDKLIVLLETLLSRKDEAEDFSTAKPGDRREKPDTFTDLIPAETLPESERGENPVVDSLRSLRPFIQSSGDRNAIDTYNAAMKAAKRGNVGPAVRLIAACDWQPELIGNFQKMVDRRRAELLGDRTSDSERYAEDRQPEPESYRTMVDRTRQRMLREKK